MRKLLLVYFIITLSKIFIPTLVPSLVPLAQNDLQNTHALSPSLVAKSRIEMFQQLNNMKKSYLTTTGKTRPLPTQIAAVLDNEQFRFFSQKILATLKALDKPDSFLFTVYSGSAYSMIANTKMHDLDFCVQRTQTDNVLNSLLQNGFSYRTGHATAMNLMNQFLPVLSGTPSMLQAEAAKTPAYTMNMGFLTPHGIKTVTNAKQRADLIQQTNRQIRKKLKTDNYLGFSYFPSQVTHLRYNITMEFVLNSLPFASDMQNIMKILNQHFQGTGILLDPQYTWIRHFSDFKDGITINALRISFYYAKNELQIILSSTIPSVSPLSIIDDIQNKQLKIIPAKNKWMTSYTLLKAIDYATKKALKTSPEQQAALKFKNMPDNKTLTELEDTRAAKIMFQKLWDRYDNEHAIGNLLCWMFEYQALDRPFVSQLIFSRLFEQSEKNKLFADSEQQSFEQIRNFLRPDKLVLLPSSWKESQKFETYMKKMIMKLVKKHNKKTKKSMKQIYCAA